MERYTLNLLIAADASPLVPLLWMPLCQDDERRLIPPKKDGPAYDFRPRLSSLQRYHKETTAETKSS